MKNPSMKNPSMKISPYEKYIILTKQKSKYYDFARAVNCTRKLSCLCAYACTCDCTRVRKQYATVSGKY